jgi:hypothetical protein
MNVTVQSLQEAHELLHREWPGSDAPASAWLAHHRRAAEVYAHVAQTDPGHRNEALFWARQEQEQVRTFTEQVQAGDNDEEQ